MKFFKGFLYSSAALASLTAGGQAFAQDGNAGEGADDGTIIVSARRIDERLQDVPISVTALDANKLNSLNITGPESLAKFVPGLIATSRYSPEQASFSIRGFTQELRTSASVGVYFADVVAPRGGGASISGGDGAGPANLFDLQSIQVLKGPQGTLFGRNTTGGAVLLIPNKPTDRFEGHLEGSYGNYNMFRIQGVLNIPIADTVRLRLGAERLTRDGYMKNISGIGPKRYADIDYIAARGSLAIDLTPDIENTTIGSFMQSDHVPAGYTMYRNNPTLTVGLAALAKVQVDRLRATADPYDVDINLRNPRTYTKQWQVINTTAFQLSDAVTLRNIMSYSEIVQILRMNNFGSNFTTSPGNTFVSSGFIFAQKGQHTNDQRNFTEEVQLQGTAFDGKLNWQTGVYYEKSSPNGLIGGSGASVRAVCLDIPFETANDFRCNGGTVNVSMSKISFTNMAAYGQGTYALTDQLKLTAGLRYTYDRSRGLGIAKVRSFAATGFGPAGPEVCEPGYTGDCSLASRTSSKRATWTLNAAYNPVPDVMVYATWTRGYRQGAVNPQAAPSAQTFDPESIDAYEIGAKTSFRAGSISGMFNIAGYYNDLTNQQLQFALQPFAGFVGSNRTSNFNAGKSRIKGVEADVSIRFGEFFRLDGAINRLATKLISVDVPSFPNYTIIPTADKGGALPNSPKWSGNVMGTVMLPVGEGNGRIDLSAIYRFQSSVRIQAASVTDLVTTPVRQVDVTLNWRDFMGAPIDLQLFANNVTKQVAITAVSGLQRTLGFDTVQLGEPRTFGARLKVRFGEGVSN